MNVLIASAEVAPFAKVGGLADVIAGLPRALVAQGHDCRVIMPYYAVIAHHPEWQIETVIEAFEVHLNPVWTKTASLHKTVYKGVTTYFVGTDEWFDKAVDSGSVYQPGGEVHAFFSAAILRAMELIDWIPDVLHANDWHTGFVPVLLKEKAGPVWRNTKSVFTIHNLAYQGEFGIEALDWMGLPHDLYNFEEVEAWGRVNFLKAGMAFADQVNTVSPSYAREIQTTEFGCGLDGLCRFLDANGRLHGILNGLDDQDWNPATDTSIAAKFSVDDLVGKAKCRADLLKRAGLPEREGAMVVGMVSRLSSQKGFDLVLTAAERLVDLNLQLVVQGLGDEHLVAEFKILERRFPDHFRLFNVFDAELAQQVYAGSDAFLMPSSFEPCGLGQLIAFRYGTVPIVRATGGLKDTVFEGGNGFVFKGRNSLELVSCLMRARVAFEGPNWKFLQEAGMEVKSGWADRAAEYVGLYEKARAISSHVML